MDIQHWDARQFYAQQIAVIAVCSGCKSAYEPRALRTGYTPRGPGKFCEACLETCAHCGDGMFGEPEVVRDGKRVHACCEAAIVAAMLPMGRG